MLQEYRKADLNAPRYRIPQHDPISKDFLKRLRDKHPQYKRWSDSRIKKLIKASNEVILDTIIDYRDGVQLPENMGRMFIGSCLPPKKQNVDHFRSALLNKKVQQRNWESDNFLAKIFFSTYELKHHFRNHHLYGFKFCRIATRSVGAAYPQNWKRYIQIDHQTNISKLFRTLKFKDKKEEENAEILKNYDEFNLD